MATEGILCEKKVILKLIVMLLILYIFLRIQNQKWRRKSKKSTEEFGDEVKACVDSRIYERPYFFLGVPFIIVFGGIGSKYESIFSIEYEGKIVVVLYHGFCLVSAGDRLRIHGNWYRGKKLGIQGNVVVAHRVENLNTGLVFSREWLTLNYYIIGVLKISLVWVKLKKD